MIIKRYIVKDMNEAVTRIRYELGKEAVIISQRKVRKPGFAGFFSKKNIEVTAAIESIKNKDDNSIEKVIESVKSKDDNSIEEGIEAIRKVISKENIQQQERMEEKEKSEEKENNAEKARIEEKQRILEAIKDAEENNEVTSNLLKEMHEMKSIMSNIMAAKEIEKVPEKTPRKSKLQQRLEATDINETLCKKIISRMKSIEGNFSEDEKLKSIIKKMIPISTANIEGKVMLVGPTGVGKTTTIAKLAGKLSLVEKKKVGLITVDTYRIGAVEQLRTYAEIMGLPFKVVITIKEMEVALENMKDCDVILIDTTGRSSKNIIQISELKTFVEMVDTRNIHLVISSTTKNKDIESIVDGFKPLNYNNLIITKLDETSTYGSILNIIDLAKKPISIVTTGQNVPDDIKNVTAEELSSLILGEDIVC